MDKLFYKLDNILVKYPSFKLWILAFLSIISIVIGGLFLFFENGVFSSSLWNAWTYLVDPGTHVELSNGYNRVISIGITVIGMLIFALLIGLISEIINDKFNQLKTGKTCVYEEDHFLILGWSDKIKSLIPQIDMAIGDTNSNIVILSTEDKDIMEEYINNNINNINVDVICRNGDVDDYFNLNKVNVQKSKYILLLANPLITYSDEINLKVILTLLKKFKLINIPITIEIENDKNKNIFKELELEYSNLNIIYTKDSLSRLLAQSSIYQGVTKVYNKLFDYRGNSFNLIENINFYNMSLFNISKIIDNTSLCGIYSFNKQALVIDKNYIYQKNDKVLTLLNDDEIRYCKKQEYEKYSIVFQKKIQSVLLIIGYSDVVDIILQELNNSVDYKIIIASKNNIDIQDEYENIKLSIIKYEDIHELIELDIDKILIVPEYTDTTSIQKDSHVLSILMTLRIKLKDIIIISEIFNSNTMDLVLEESTNDYIVSNDLISKFLASVSYSNEVKIIINDLLSAGGNLIKVIDTPNKNISYYNLYYNLLQTNIVLLGYIRNKSVNLNPENNTLLIDNDKIIIIENNTFNFYR